MEGIDIVNEAFAVLYKCSGFSQASSIFLPVRCVQVFTEVDPVVGNMVEQFFKSHDLLLHGMTPVVYEDIYPANVALNLLQEIPVRLRSDQYFNVFFFKFPAFGVNIHPINSGPRPEIFLPHLETASMENTYFKNYNVLS